MTNNPYTTAQIARYATADTETRQKSREHWIKILAESDPTTLPEPACIADLAARNLAILAMVEYFEAMED